MPELRYIVAMSLDGFIAGPQGEHDWITMDPEVDFAALWSRHDTLLMGRRTFRVLQTRLGSGPTQGKRVVVASRTLQADDPTLEPNVTILTEVTAASLAELRAGSSQGIWLMGGGDLFRSVLALDEVDGIEVTLVPVLLGGGTALAPQIVDRARLKLQGHRVYPNSGLITLSYAVERRTP